MRARPGLNRTSSMLTEAGEGDQTSEGSVGTGTGRSPTASMDLNPADWEVLGEGGSEDGRAAVGASRAGEGGAGGAAGAGGALLAQLFCFSRR